MKTPSIQQQYRLAKDGQAFELRRVDALVVEPGPEQVLVRVRATSLNRRDLLVFRSFYPLGEKTSLVPLSDGAGEVVAVGSGVTRFQPGDRVAATFFQGWISGRPPGNLPALALGGGLDGMLSQFVTLDEQGLVLLPADLSFEEGATLPCAAVTAWSGLLASGGLQPGDWVLLQGTGGVSIFGLQFAVAAGARAIVTSSSDAKLERAKALGAAGTINYRAREDWDAAARELSGGGVHHVLEIGGEGTLARSLASLAQGGRLALIGGLEGFGGNIPAVSLLTRSATASGITVGSREDFDAMNAFIDRHRLKPVIDRVFEFDEARAAFDHMESGAHFGKIVVRVA